MFILVPYKASIQLLYNTDQHDIYNTIQYIIIMQTRVYIAMYPSIIHSLLHLENGKEHVGKWVSGLVMITITAH